MTAEHNQEQIAALAQQTPPQYPIFNLPNETCTKILETYKGAVLLPCWDDLSQCNFDQIGSKWMAFWSSLSESQRPDAASEAMRDALVMLDYIFLERASNVLIPDVLDAVEPKLASTIREFAKALPKSALQSADHCAPGYMEKKMEVVQLFSGLIRCQTSLNHVAQAARAVLRSEKNTEQMLSDWDHVDFVDVERQVEWTCPEALEMMRQMHQGFGQCLRTKRALEQYTAWADSVMSGRLPQGLTPKARIDALEGLVIQWTFVMSLIMRDLTLRSAAAFGNFHLFSLLFHEYLMYMIEVAKKDAMDASLRQQIAPLL